MTMNEVCNRSRKATQSIYIYTAPFKEDVSLICLVKWGCKFIDDLIWRHLRLTNDPRYKLCIHPSNMIFFFYFPVTIKNNVEMLPAMFPLSYFKSKYLLENIIDSHPLFVDKVRWNLAKVITQYLLLPNLWRIITYNSFEHINISETLNQFLIRYECRGESSRTMEMVSYFFDLTIDIYLEMTIGRWKK